jgi:hypothetical protein
MLCFTRICGVFLHVAMRSIQISGVMEEDMQVIDARFVFQVKVLFQIDVRLSQLLGLLGNIISESIIRREFFQNRNQIRNECEDWREKLLVRGGKTNVQTDIQCFFQRGHVAALHGFVQKYFSCQFYHQD